VKNDQTSSSQTALRVEEYKNMKNIQETKSKFDWLVYQPSTGNAEKN